MLSAGAPVSPQVIERFAALLPADARIFTPYGATEALPVASIGSAEILGETRHGTDRRAGRLRRPAGAGHVASRIIRSPTRRSRPGTTSLRVPPGEVGEIVGQGAAS